MKTHYYISTGAQNCYYTLRYTFEEACQISAGDGVAPVISSITRDYHVQNLSIDRAQAIAKAREITGLGLDADFDVLPIGERASSIDWSVLQGGKHAGKSILELLASDEGKGYLLWLCENCEGSKGYGKTVELAKAYLAHELAQRADDRTATAAQAEADKASRIARYAPAYELLKDGGEFCKSIALGLAAGDLPSGRGLSIMVDILAKKTGGRYNSKAYWAEYEGWESDLGITA